jgi:hypothetical protein
VCDAADLVRESSAEFSHQKLINLRNYRFHLKLMIDGAVWKPFSAETLPVL